MRQTNRLPIAILSLCAFLWSALSASAQPLAPFKDELFAYPGIISAADGGGKRVIAYDKMRDIHARDEEPERRVHAKYVSLSARRQQEDLVAETAAGKIRHFAVGARQNARLIVVYLHGQGGSRKQGVDDWTFGGNFNRIKNMVIRAGGVYLSPDFTDFNETGTAEVSALISLYSRMSPGAKVYVACGSMGGRLCWSIANDERMVKSLGGLLLLGSLWDESFLSSDAFRARVPLYIGQGSSDTVFPLARIEAFYESIRKKSKDYPVRLVVFDTGSHGTPIRMTDWRETINWMQTVR